MKEPKIAVLIPCYNEALTIGNVVRDFRKYLPYADIYVYDNNSTDETKTNAIKAGAFLRQEHQQGKGNVMRKMFREIDADCYIIVDGDETYSAKDAPELVRLVLEEQYDMVIGDRLSSTYFQENKRVFHNFGNKLVRWLINKLWKSNIKDIMTGYRSFSKRFIKLFPVMAQEFEIETEMTVHALDKRYYIKEIPIEYKDRPQGSCSKLSTFKDGIKVLRTILILFKEYKPFPFFSSIAILLITLSIALFIPIFIEYMHTGMVPKFPTLFMSVFFALSGLMAFFTGLCLDIIISKDKKNYELNVLNFK